MPTDEAIQSSCRKDCFVVELLAMTESRPRLPLQIQDTELET